MENLNLFVDKDNSGKIISYLRQAYNWFEFRYNEMDIEHKTLIGKMLDANPSIGYHLDDIFKSNFDKEGNLPRELWRVTSSQADLLCMLALPYDESEMVLTDDTGLLDASGNKILKGGQKSFKAQ